MNKHTKHKIPENRPAFHVDESLKEAAANAARAFEEEEKEINSEEYAKT